MYNYQKGLLPISLNFIGIFIPSLFFIFGIKTLIPLYIKSIDTQPINEVLSITINLLVGLSIYLILPIFIGILLSGLFPALAVSKNGIRYMYFGGVVRGEILWGEVISLRKLKDDYLIIMLERKGIPLLNGLYFNSLYGRLFGVSQPIILLSPSLTNRENIVINIEKNIA